jgi:hypothetical protein
VIACFKSVQSLDRSRKRMQIRSEGIKSEEGSTARAFFAGRYAEIVEKTFDSQGIYAAHDVAFVVGALTFLARLDDAQLCWDAFRRRGVEPDARSEAAVRFFLGIGFGRAGDFNQSRRFLVTDARTRMRSGDPWIDAFLFQGLACQRYFTGRYRAAARHGLRALRAAHVAHFGYVQMLANDLRGHALARIGHYRAGINLLEQARKISERLGFGMNAYAFECSIASYTADSVSHARVLDLLEELLERRTHDSYSKRQLLSDHATQLALRGRGSEALVSLERADADALVSGTRRAKLTNLVARLNIVRWSHGARGCEALLPQAQELLDESDAALRADLLGFEAYVGLRLGDAVRRQRALEGLRSLVRSSELHRARAALEQFEDVVQLERPFPEDEITPLLHAVTTGQTRVLPKLLSQGILAPVPELLGLSPNKRIVLLARENALLAFNEGDVVCRDNPPRWAITLLRLLVNGSSTKEAITFALWGLRRYHPERHDSLIRTTIHRLRTLLGRFGVWIEAVEGGGYRCSAPMVSIDTVGAGLDFGDIEPPLLEGQIPEVESPSISPNLRAQKATSSDRVLRVLTAQDRPMGAGEIANALRISESTVLRALRLLLKQKSAVSTGHARATRYTVSRHMTRLSN